MKRPRLKLHVLTGLVGLSLVWAAFTPAMASAAPSHSSSQTIVQIAAGDPHLSTLVTALKAAGLVETLNSPGPFTVFAPTNAAFNKLGKATITALLANKPKLTSILLYHVLSGRVSSKQAAKAGHATTLNGQDVVITLRHGEHEGDDGAQSGSDEGESGGLFINNARVVIRDVQASNGVIHVIDTVLMPPSKDIVATLASKPQFSTLVAAVKVAGLVETLKSAGPFTLFAPTNAAFAKLPKGTLAALLQDPAKLRSILLYHALAGKVYSTDAKKLRSAVTINGARVRIRVDDGEILINQAEVIRADVLATNGVIHAIDAVLLPPQ